MAIPHNSKCRYGERGAADAVPQLPERCLSRKAGTVRCCLNPPPVKNPIFAHFTLYKIHTNIKAATPAAWHDTAGVAVIYGR